MKISGQNFFREETGVNRLNQCGSSGQCQSAVRVGMELEQCLQTIADHPEAEAHGDQQENQVQNRIGNRSNLPREIPAKQGIEFS